MAFVPGAFSTPPKSPNLISFSPIRSFVAQTQSVHQPQSHYTQSRAGTTTSLVFTSSSPIPSVAQPISRFPPHMTCPPNYGDMCRMVRRPMSGEPAGGVDQFIPQCGHSAPWVPHPANVPEYMRDHQSPVMDPQQRRAPQPCMQSQGGQVGEYPSHAYQSNLDQVNLSSTQGQINLMYENCSAASVSPAVSPGWAESALPCQSSCASGLAADTLTDAANTNSDRVPPVEPVSLPETLSYNGTGSWEAFCNKFEMFVDYHKLSEEDKQY